MGLHTIVGLVNEVETALDEYIEYYNKDRIKLRLDGMSPAQKADCYKDKAGPSTATR